jgi:hypothetical protein
MPRRAKNRVKRQPNAWIRALKQWNQGKDRYTVPKSGTSDYQEVRKIMESLK